MRVKRKPAAEKLDRSVSCAVTAVNIKGTAIRMITIKTINIRTRKNQFQNQSRKYEIYANRVYELQGLEYLGT